MKVVSVVVAVGWGVEPAAVGQRRGCCDSGEVVIKPCRGGCGGGVSVVASAVWRWGGGGWQRKKKGE
nr:hypothetical protein [Tanacetum cinerariifolium]GFA61826.1 hypothetical protein [Tanacetum cinerariifolium]